MAASTTYTNVNLLKLPKYYDTSSDLTTSDLTTVISEVSRYIDSKLATVYIPFNSTSGTPPTPTPVQAIATHLAEAWVLRKLMLGDRNSDFGRVADDREAWALSKIDALVNGVDQLDPEQKTGAVLVKGTGGTYDLDTDEAFIGVETLVSSGEVPTVIHESVKITSPSGYMQYHYGEDFVIRFDPRHQKWVFSDRRNDFISQTSPTISYWWTWERYVWDRTPGRTRSPIFYGGI